MPTIDTAGLGKGTKFLLVGDYGMLDLVESKAWSSTGGATVTIAPTAKGNAFIYPGNAALTATGYAGLSSGVGTVFLWCPTVGNASDFGVVLVGSQSPNAFAPQIHPDRSMNIPGPGRSLTALGSWFNTANRSLVVSMGSTASAINTFLDGAATDLAWSGASPNAWGSGSKTIALGRYPASPQWDFQGSILVAGWTDELWTATEAAAFHAAPLSVLLSGEPPAPGHGFVKVSGSWKTLSGVYVNVAGTWKSGQFIPNVSGSWKPLS